MQIKQYVKNVGKAVLEPVIKSLGYIAPNFGTGLSMMSQRIFSWGLDGNQAYSNKIFYSATNILVRKLTEAPIMFSKKKPQSSAKLEKFYSKSISNENRKAFKALNLVELEDHELNKLFDDPNGYQSGIEMMEDFWHNYGFGDGYLFFEDLGETSRNKKPYRVHSLPRSKVMPIRSYDKHDRILEYRFTAWNGDQFIIPKSNLLHLPHWNPNIGEMRGLGVDVISSMDISLNNANNEMQGASFTNGGRGTILSSDIILDKDGEAVEKMTAPQMEVLKQSVERDYQGIRNYKKIHFSNGYVNVQQFGDTLVENDAIKAEDGQWKSIFTIVGVPWALSPAASSVSENSIIVGYKSLVTNLVISELRKFDQKLNQKIQQWWPEIIACHDLTEFSELAPDLKLMKEVYGSPLLRNDELRAVFGYDEIGGDAGKAILVPSGLITLDDLLATDDVDDSETTTL